MNLFFFIKNRSIHQYFITQGKGRSSMFHTFRTIFNFRVRFVLLLRVGGGEEESQGSTPVYEACLKHNQLMNL